MCITILLKRTSSKKNMDDQVANLFTRGLNTDKCEDFRYQLNMVQRMKTSANRSVKISSLA